MSSSYTGGGGGDDEEQALLDRMAKREERRLRRMKEALDRQKELDPTAADVNDSIAVDKNNVEEETASSWRQGRYRDNQDEEEASPRREEPREEEDAAPEVEEEVDEGVDEEVEVVEDKPRMSYLREQVSHLVV